MHTSEGMFSHVAAFFLIWCLIEAINDHGVLLLQNSAPAHTSQVAMAAATNTAWRSFLIPRIL